MIVRGSWLLVQLERALADVHGQIRAPLEIRDDLHRRGDQPQVPRQRLLQREQFHAEVVDLDLQTVDLGVLGDHPARDVRVPIDESGERPADRLLDATPHL